MQRPAFSSQRRAALDVQSAGGIVAFLIVRTDVNVGIARLITVVAVESRTVIRATSVDLVVIAIVNALVIADLIAVVVIAKGAVVAQRAVVAPRNTERDVHAVITLIVIFVAKTVHRQTDPAHLTDIEIVRQRQVIAVLVRLIPVGAMGVVDIGVDVYCRKVLAVRQGIHLFIVAGALTIVIVIMRIDKLVHRHVVFFGKAITSKRQTAVYIIKIFSVAGTERVTLNGAVAVGATLWQRRTGMGDIDGKRAQQRQIAPQS